MSTPNQGVSRRKAAPAAGQSAFAQAAQSAGLVAEQGKGAVEGRYRASVDCKLPKAQFTGSVDMDEAFRVAEGQAHRWDYGLGVQPPLKSEMAIWVEPHPASSNGEVKVVLAKLDWLKAKLRLADFKRFKVLTDECVNQGVRPYHWLASGHVGIRPGSREANMLARAGMGLPSQRVVI